MRFIDRVSAIIFDQLGAAVALLTTTNETVVVRVGLASPGVDSSNRR